MRDQTNASLADALRALAGSKHPVVGVKLAQAFLQTKNIRLGPGGFLLPYHHPAELANRVAMLDHLSGGRLNFSVGPQHQRRLLRMHQYDR